MTIYELGTRVQTPEGPGLVEFITKRGMPKMGYTVKLDNPIEVDGEWFERVQYGHDEVKPA